MSKVSRSIYQKCKEENKRLLKDIKLLTSRELSGEKILLIEKWRKHFDEEKKFNMLIKEVSRKWMEDNPDSPIVQAVKSMGK
jgi:hypothetical protein